MPLAELPTVFMDSPWRCLCALDDMREWNIYKSQRSVHKRSFGQAKPSRELEEVTYSITFTVSQTSLLAY